MRYSDDIIADIRFGNDIVDIINQYTHLKQRGNSYVGLCPFHKEATPSFYVSSDKQLYNCFGCGASGTVYNFIMDIENYDFLDAVKYLADRINYTLPSISNLKADNKLLEVKEQLYKIHKLVARHFYDNLSSPQGKIANEYLDKRGINHNIRIKFGIGYSLPKKNDIYNFLKEKGFNDDIILQSGLVIKGNDNSFFDRFSGRLMFPIIDVQGRIVGFGGRELFGNKNIAKYLNSPDTHIFNKSYNLYSLNFAKNSKKKEFILVEGYMDVISLYQAGIHNVVAALGTAFNENHVKSLKRYANKVILLFDSDEPGIKATLKAIPILLENGISVKVSQVEGAKDPDEYIKKFGINSFLKLLISSESHVMFQIKQKLKEYDINDLVQKVEFTKDVSNIISRLDSPIEQDVFVKETETITGISQDSIKQEIKNIIGVQNNIIPKKYNKITSKNQNSKLDKARKSILYILATNKHIYEKLKHYIKPEEFLENIYINFAKLIFENYENKIEINPADVILQFNDTVQQREISKIFMMQFSEDEQIEKAINDRLKIIKKAYIEKMLLQEKNANAVKEILQERKYLEKLYISID